MLEIKRNKIDSFDAVLYVIPKSEVELSSQLY